MCDMAAHIFWYSKHIATVHVEHGKYHVHCESLEAAKKSYPEKNTAITKAEIILVAEHFTPQYKYDFTIPLSLTNHFIRTHCFLPDHCLDNEAPPPKSVA